MIDKKIFKAYLELTKPSILTLVLVTTTLGFYLGGHGHIAWERLLFLLLGTALTCAGSGVLNHYIERDVDRKMDRTKNRPIPTGKISPENAFVFGFVLIVFGITILYVKINILTAFLSLVTTFMYLLIYTPMKRISWLNTTIGAFPGAMPPLGGWAAATNHLNFEAGILFLILFLWQHPHFYAIAWIFRKDYEKGGFKMLPVIEPDGQSTFRQILWYSLILIPVSITPTLIGLSGYIYFIGALLASLSLFFIGFQLSKEKSLLAARNLLKATVFYLPVLLLLIIFDVTF